MPVVLPTETGTRATVAHFTETAPKRGLVEPRWKRNDKRSHKNSGTPSSRRPTPNV